MSKKFIQQHTKQAFSHLTSSSTHSIPAPQVSQTNISVTNPASVVHELVRQKYEREQILLKQQQEELEQRKQAKLLQEQQLLKQKKEFAALKARLELEKATALQEQQQKIHEKEALEEQLKKEKERVLKGEFNLKLEQESFEKEREELVGQSQDLQNQIKLLIASSSSVSETIAPAFLFLTDDTPENEYTIGKPKTLTPPPSPTEIDPEYVEIAEDTAGEEAVRPPTVPEAEITLEGATDNGSESEYEII